MGGRYGGWTGHGTGLVVVPGQDVFHLPVPYTCLLHVCHCAIQTGVGGTYSSSITRHYFIPLCHAISTHCHHLLCSSPSPTPVPPTFTMPMPAPTTCLLPISYPLVHYVFYTVMPSLLHFPPCHMTFSCATFSSILSYFLPPTVLPVSSPMLSLSQHSFLPTVFPSSFLPLYNFLYTPLLYYHEVGLRGRGGGYLGGLCVPLGGEEEAVTFLPAFQAPLTPCVYTFLHTPVSTFLLLVFFTLLPRWSPSMCLCQLR